MAGVCLMVRPWFWNCRFLNDFGGVRRLLSRWRGQMEVKLTGMYKNSLGSLRDGAILAINLLM